VTTSPLITIGVPVYNAALHLGTTLESLLAQTFADFELIVSDNASTDETRDIVEEFRRKDSRIRYERHAVNIGANGNYAGLVHLARGTLFKWSAASDWCAPTFLERCKSELLAHADTVLAAPRTRLFQEHPAEYQDYEWDIEVLDDTPSERLRRLTSELSLNNAMNGLIRIAALRSARAMGPYLGADVVLMGELVLRGKFRLIDERLFYRRMDVATATAMQARSSVWTHHYPTRSARSLFQGTKRQWGWIVAVLRAPISVSERARTLLHVAKRCYWERGVFWRDLRGAWQYLTRRTWPD
jgi:glycosyltransferase involved in cell wall biosynthesis